MKKHCIAMLLAGGQGSRLYALTAKVAKPNIPFGGKYRIIDFPLSNCANSGIDTVGVLTQYQPLLLNRYIGSGQAWDLDSIDGGVYILPPYQSAGERGSWFSGTANAIYQNMDFIEMYDPDCVLILSGDHVYKMDYDKMLRAHEQAGAACTISVIQVSMEEASRFGIMNVGPDGFINEFEEKPAHPKSDLASMGIYIFDWKVLRRFGYRNTLVGVTACIGLMIAQFSLQTPSLPLWMLILPMILLGMAMSTQFTAMNSITLGDLAQEHVSTGNSLLAVTQQLSISFGVASSTAVLRLFNALAPGSLLDHFHETFLTVGGVTLLASLVFLFLRDGDGDALLPGRGERRASSGKQRSSR